MEWFFVIWSTVMFVGAFILWKFSERHLEDARQNLQEAVGALEEASVLLADAKRINKDAIRTLRAGTVQELSGTR